MNEICAKQALREAGQRNPGPWIGHSESVAQNAKLIAQRCGPRCTKGLCDGAFARYRQAGRGKRHQAYF